MKNIHTLFAAIAILASVTATHAATITWSTQANAGPALLDTTLEAHNFDDDAAATIGIWTTVVGNTAATTYANIHPTLNAGGGATGTNGTIAATGDANLDQVLGEHAWSNNVSETFTLSNLTAGDTYRIQFYFSDVRAGSAGNQVHFDDGNGNDSNVFARGDQVSTYGTFVADGTGTQTINYISDTVSGGLGLNGYVISTTPVPEPTSTALLGLGGLALILRRRK